MWFLSHLLYGMVREPTIMHVNTYTVNFSPYITFFSTLIVIFLRFGISSLFFVSLFGIMDVNDLEKQSSLEAPVDKVARVILLELFDRYHVLYLQFAAFLTEMVGLCHRVGNILNLQFFNFFFLKPFTEIKSHWKKR